MEEGAVKPVGREFSNIYIEIDGKLEQLRDLPIHEYEEFLEDMHKLRLAYMSGIGIRRN